MKINKNNILKYTTIVFFLGFIFIFPIINFLTEDKKINEIENKILTQLPKLSLQKIINGSFMKEADNYTSDQFPSRTEFIKIKNSYSYSLGIREFRGIYVGSNGRLMEKFIFNKEIIDKNIAQVIRLSRHLQDMYKIPSTLMVVPTSIAFYENELPNVALTDSQEDTLNYIHSRSEDPITNNLFISFYSPYHVLKENKNEYIYFNTDHHWTQLGAKLAFEDMYGSINGDYTKVIDEFYGTYFSKALLPNIKGDSIYAYKDFNNFNMKIDFNKNFDSLYDDYKLLGKNKYQYFLHGDPAIAIIEGLPDNANNEILVFKDSFAHNFVPFLASKYTKVHIIDPRYYNLDIDTYIKENENIKEVLFLNNISTFNSSLLFK